MGGGTFFKVEGRSARQKNYGKLLWFELAIVISQAFKSGGQPPPEKEWGPRPMRPPVPLPML